MSLTQPSPSPTPTKPASRSLRLHSEKITNRHLERLAMVYVRQSTAQQLVRHKESTQVQYNLKLRAQEMGWPEERIIVIDDDLGKSGASAEGRLGFQRLVTEVTFDHVGIILGVEMSRLTRSCKDWYHLLEVCSVFGTLIADLDGVYEPAQYNDRLLLGLKGKMSEAELHILKKRMKEGRLNKARRGELIFDVPIGYIKRPSGDAVFDPDEQVQEIVRLVFGKFDELGTLNSVLKFLVNNGVKLPVRARCGLNKGELEWHRPCRMTLQNMLKNPIYAGAYTYGRRAIDPRRKVPGRPHTGRTVVAPEQCQVFLKDCLPAYLSWDQYEHNQERLLANRAVSEAIGVPKNGPSLLSGLVVCGKCGRRMNVRYGGSHMRHSYFCNSLLSDYGQKSCQSLAGPSLDSFVSQQALKALDPASVELSLKAAEHVERQRQEQDNLWQKRLERAKYDAERAARQYAHVEPENRLVARQLEQEWEEKLRHQKQLEEKYDRLLRDQPRLLTAEEREMIRKLSADIPALWGSPHTTLVDRKEILRQVIDRVVIDVIGESERVELTIRWAGGIETHQEMVRPVARLDQLSYWPQLVDRIGQLAAQNMNAQDIAEQLNTEGWRPPKRRKRFGRQGVQDLLCRLGLSERRSRSTSRKGLGENEWWLRSLAQQLEMPAVTMYAWLHHGWVRSRRSDQGRWILWADAGEMERLRQLRNVPRGYHTRRHWIGNNNTANGN